MFDLNRRIEVRHQNKGEGGSVQTVTLLCAADLEPYQTTVHLCNGDR